MTQAMVLEKTIDELKRIIAGFSTEQVLGTIANQLYFSTDLIADSGLNSPYKEYLYLAGLLFSSAAEGTADYTPKDVARIKALLEDIVWYYFLRYLPGPGEDRTELSEEWWNSRKISMPVFLNYFNTIELNYIEQQRSRIKRWFYRFNDYFSVTFGFTVQDLLGIFSFIGDSLQNAEDKLKASIDEAKRAQKVLMEAMENADFTMENLKAKSREMGLHVPFGNFMKNLALTYHVPISELEKKYDKQIVHSFIQHFAIRHAQRKFKYFTEVNPFEKAPIWYKDDKFLFIAFYKQILNAIYRFCYESLETSRLSRQFLKHRDSQVECEAMEIFEKLFGGGAEYYKCFYETPDSHFEHDGLIIFHDTLIIIEAKASKMKEPFRDPDKAAIRIRRDFHSDRGIQKAYDQAYHLKTSIRRYKYMSLYDNKGNILRRIETGEFTRIFIILVTAENFGLVAANLSLLLKKERDEPYPLCCNLYDLDTVVDAFVLKKLGPREFLVYLSERERLHTKFMASDELEICGYYLRYDGFSEIDKRKADKIYLSPDMSSIFDEIYFAKHGVTYKRKHSMKPFFVDIKDALRGRLRKA